MNPQLILVEGLPGSGKSTFSRYITVQGERNQQPVTWYHEVAKGHPTSFFHEACLRQEEYDEFCNEHPQARSVLERLRYQREAWICFDLLDVERGYGTEIGEAACRALQRYDVWNFPPHQYRDVALVKWRHFVEQVLASGQTVMLDSSIFQFQIYGQLLEDLSQAEIKQWVRQLFEVVAPLHPLLVYFYQQDVDRAIQSLFDVRGQAWVESIMERDRHMPYFRARTTPDVETYQQLLKDYRRIADELFIECEHRKIGIDVSEKEWGRYEGQLLEFLGLSYVADPPFSEEMTQALTGVYRNHELDVSVEITAENGTLYFGKSKKKLIPKSGLTFYINDNSVEVIFAKKEDQGITMTMGGMPLIDAWSTTGTEYVRESDPLYK